MKDFWISWVSLLLEGVPFLFLGSALASGITLLIPSENFLSRIPSARFPRLLCAMLAGMILPLCECASILVVRRLMKRGLPLDAALIYFFTGALLNPITVFTTHTAFLNRNALEMTTARFGLGFFLVLGIGLWVSRLKPSEILKTEISEVEEHCHSGGKWTLWQRESLEDFFLMLPYFLIGSAAAALFNTQVPWSSVAGLMENHWISPLLAILVAQGMSLCSTVDAFVIAPFASLPNHSKIAFLVAGPLFDMKLLAMYLLLFQKRWIFKLWIVVVLGAWTLSLLGARFL